jgi:hypothetical protein
MTPLEVKSLQALSKRTGLQVSELIRRAIDAYIESQSASKTPTVASERKRGM